MWIDCTLAVPAHLLTRDIQVQNAQFYVTLLYIALCRIIGVQMSSIDILFAFELNTVVSVCCVFSI